MMKYIVKNVSGETVAQFDEYVYAFIFMKAYFDSFSVVTGDGLMIIKTCEESQQVEQSEQSLADAKPKRGRKAKNGQ